MTATIVRATEKLTETDRRRLESFAPLFDINIDRTAAPDTFVDVRVLDRGGWRTSRIPAARLHTRLLAEICAKTLRWVYYPVGQPCQEALLKLTDERVTRISVLYQQQKTVLLDLSADTDDSPALLAA
ncbi:MULTISPECIES: hypothetical protein [unclassified Variovorax]|uniref:hypothetical protein n=1 Tax=unclassified Variovorax TaxID=663243 RepID=UPI00076C7B5B|nr:MULTISPECIES: hypothetical protein [unclassified Variovorax]KWT98372.1 hypothetical protein APY03_0507 [Variovorax sp. WDL1]PNG49968.1 hypothetical protein CHC06_05549 [Variovorax sp. B2]PNG50840.1 hypothetical protein CHC07_05454 [Variovorax sp. B4]VTU41763.1 hypothetical protein H6P1_00041 [Variovorax sp. PBL-H6]VTU44554.1 hypothetical protein SRS16P1_00861 [Variovorax sp. SRS16]